MANQSANGTSEFLGNRYQLIDEIGTGGMGVVYRSFDKLTGQHVALKRINLVAGLEQLNDSNQRATVRKSLMQEFRTLASLRHPNIISVLDYGFDTAYHPYFTMELLDNPSDLVTVAREKQDGERAQLIVQVLQALAYLHHRGIVHRDIKPDNLMVVDGVVKVLDFGLAVAKEYDTSDQEVAGTLAYMAPEVLEAAPPSSVSDLYSIGILLYEIYTGEHPFNVSNITQLLQDILVTIPNTAVPELEGGLDLLIGRLLSKDTADRYQSAQQVIDEFIYVTDQPEPSESLEIRESYLQGAEFVARDDELQQLKIALDGLKAGSSSIWLVGGESGVGKSRILDELRILALVAGVQVVRGGAVREGAGAYQLWQNVLRQLILNTTISDEEAQLLHPIIPQLDQLIGRDIPESETGEVEGRSDRLSATIGSIFQRQTRPILILLEDLHWSSDLDILTRLGEKLTDLQVMLVGSYRSDERAGLPAELPIAKSILLNRLDEQGITNLTTAILGPSTELDELVGFLTRETEGNIFFIIEVMRVLADEAQGLESITAIELPDSVYSQGVDQVVQRRLNKVSSTAREALKLASIIGRQLDLDMLKHLLPDLDVTAWLLECSNAFLLEALERDWRFAHDKIREAILREMPDTATVSSHRRVAEAIETLYPGDEQKYAILAYHWRGAENNEKALSYYEKAGTQAMIIGANKDASVAMTRALEILKELPESKENRVKAIELTLLIARVNAYSRDDSIQTRLQSALEDAKALEDEALQAKVLASLGTRHYIAGQTGQALGYFQQCMVLAEKLDLEQLLVLPYNILGRATGVMGDTRKADALLSRGLSLAEKYNDQELLTGSQAFHASNLYIQGNREAAQQSYQRALELAEALGHPSRKAANLMTTGFGKTLAGLYDEAASDLTQSLKILEETQDFHPMYVVLGCMAFIAVQKAQYDIADGHLQKIFAMVQDNYGLPNMPLFLSVQAEVDMHQANWDQASERLSAALKAAEMTQQIMSKGHILRSRSRLLRQKPEPQLEEAVKVISESLTIHDQFANEPAKALSLYEQSHVYAAQNDDVKADDALNTAIARFEQLGMTWNHAQAVKAKHS